MSNFAEESSIQDRPYVVKNTFIELEEPPSIQLLQRASSDSDLSRYCSSSGQSTPRVQDLRDSSTRTRQTLQGCVAALKDDNSDGSFCGDFSLDRSGGGSDASGSSQPNEPQACPPAPEVGHFVQTSTPSEQKESMELYSWLLGVAGTRNIPKNVLRSLEEKGALKKHVPLDSSKEPTSLGSIPHQQEPIGTECRPCLFWFVGRCLKEQSCLYCHFRHPNQKPKRLRASKNTRMRRFQKYPEYQAETDTSTNSNMSLDSSSGAGSSDYGSIASIGPSASVNSGGTPQAQKKSIISL